MNPVLVAAVGYLAYSILHVGATALCVRMLGISIVEVSLGTGAKLWSRGVLSWRAVPLGGFVKMKDSREDFFAPPDPEGAFNHQPLWKQLAVALAGPVLVLLACVGALGLDVLARLVSAFGQIVHGTIAPIAVAQGYLAAFDAFVAARGPVDAIALVFVKLAAFNLLPLATLSGGQALMILAKGGRPYAPWEEAVTRCSLFPLFAIAISWAIALAYWASQHWG